MAHLQNRIFRLPRRQLISDCFEALMSEWFAASFEHLAIHSTGPDVGALREESENPLYEFQSCFKKRRTQNTGDGFKPIIPHYVV